jgi:hypothetical protein
MCLTKKSCQKYGKIFCKLFYFLILFSENFEKDEIDDEDLSTDEEEIEEPKPNYVKGKSKSSPTKSSLNIVKPKVTQKDQPEKTATVVQSKSTKLTIKSGSVSKNTKTRAPEKEPAQEIPKKKKKTEVAQLPIESIGETSISKNDDSHIDSIRDVVEEKKRLISSFIFVINVDHPLLTLAKDSNVFPAATQRKVDKSLSTYADLKQSLLGIHDPSAADIEVNITLNDVNFRFQELVA